MRSKPLASTPLSGQDKTHRMVPVAVRSPMLGVCVQRTAAGHHKGEHAPMSNGFDLDTAVNVADLEEEGITIHLKDAEGEPWYYGEGDEQKPVTWTVLGTYSHTFRRIDRQQTQRMIKLARRGTETTVEETEANHLERIAACTKAWAGFTRGGQPVECNKQNALEILKSPRAPHIRAQVGAAMDDHARFFAQRSAA